MTGTKEDQVASSEDHENCKKLQRPSLPRQVSYYSLNNFHSVYDELYEVYSSTDIQFDNEIFCCLYTAVPCRGPRMDHWPSLRPQHRIRVRRP